MNEPRGRSRIAQTVSAQFTGTRTLQSLAAKTSSHQKSQTLSGQLTAAVATAAVLTKIRALL